MGRHTVKPLQPYEKASLTFTPEKGKWTDKADYQVVFLRDGQIVETNNFNISK
jgi:predicted alpha/beta superfamily hydrolase